MNFAEFLKNMREQKNMSKRKLASLTGLTITAITNYETGKRSPTLKIAERICEALGVKYVVGGNMRLYCYTDEEFMEDMKHDAIMEPVWEQRAREEAESEDEEE